MGEAGVLEIGAERPLPLSELRFRFSRSGGPGGQHVNTSSTRVELVFDLEGSPSLSSRERRLHSKRRDSQTKRGRRPPSADD